MAVCTDNDGDGFGAAYINVTGNRNGGNHYNIQQQVNTSNTLAQSFTIPADATIVRIGLKLNRCFPNFNNITVQVRSDLNKPNDYLVQYEITHDEIPQGPNGGWHYKLVNINLGGGKTYYLAVGSPPAGKNPHCWMYNKSGDPYKNGQLFENGSAVDKGNSDAVFELFKQGDLKECAHRNIADCNDNNASVYPPYENMVPGNNARIILCPGHYNLTDSDQNGTIRIWGQNITLVCNNTWIEGNLSPVSAAIRVETFSKNLFIGGSCNFSNYGFGGIAILGNASGGQVWNVTTYGNNQSAITLTNTAHDWLLSNIHVYGTQHGADIAFDLNTYNNTLQNSIIHSGDGVKIARNSSNNTIKNNTIHDSTSYGIEISMSNRTIYTNNKIIDNNITNCSDGIHAYNARGIQIVNNTIRNSRNDGIYCRNSTNALLDGNDIYNSGSEGMHFSTSSDIMRTTSNVINNYIFNSTDEGIEYCYLSNGSIKNNIINITGRDGIYVYNAQDGTQITGNKVYNAGKYGIWTGSVLVADFLDNTMENCTLGGFYLHNHVCPSCTKNVNIVNNTIRAPANSYGIEMDVDKYAPNVTIENNAIYANKNRFKNLTGGLTICNNTFYPVALPSAFYVSFSLYRYLGTSFNAGTALLIADGVLTDNINTLPAEYLSNIAAGTQNFSLALADITPVGGAGNASLWLDQTAMTALGITNCATMTAVFGTPCYLYLKDYWLVQGPASSYNRNPAYNNYPGMSIIGGYTNPDYLTYGVIPPLSNIMFELVTDNSTIIENNTFHNSSAYVMKASNSYNTTIQNNIFNNSARECLWIESSTNITILNNNLYSCGAGILVDPSNKINITGNYIINSTGNGITISNNTNATVYNNTASYNTENGIEVSYFANATVYNNTFCYNGKEAIYRLSATILPANFLSVNTVNCSNANIFRNAWLTQARTVYSNGSNASGATVNLHYPISNTTVLSTDTTDANGLTGYFELTEYVIDNNNVQTNYTPYLFFGILNYQTGENTTLGNMTRTASLGNEVIVTLTAANITINITTPADNSSRKAGTNFVLSANISNVGAINATGCNATLSITNTSVITLRTGSWTRTVGNVNAGASTIQTWSLRAVSAGTANTTVTLTCDNAAPINDTATNLTVTPAPPAPRGRGGGGSASRGYENAIIEQTKEENLPETEQQKEEKTTETKKQQTEETPAIIDQDNQKATVKAPEIKSEKPKETEQITQPILNNTTIIAGILIVLAIFGLLAYMTLSAKTSPTKPKTPRRKEVIDLESNGFKVKK